MVFAFSAYAHANRFSEAISAGNFYLGLGVGAGGSNNIDEVMAQMPFGNRNSSSSNAFWGLEAGFETPIISETQLLGLRLGVNWHSEAKSRVSVGPWFDEIKNTIRTIPLTAYYKHMFENSKFSVTGGLGVTFISMEWTDTYYDSFGSGSVSVTDSRTSPHIAFGAEYRFSQLFGLSLDFRYAFDGEIERGDFRRDVSFVGGLMARFYF